MGYPNDILATSCQQMPGVLSVYDVAVADATDVADVTVEIFTFTTNEIAAVTELLTRLYIDVPVYGPTVWTSTKLGDEILEGHLSDGRTARLEHHPLSAQGNVVAAAELARSVWGNREKKRADYYVFYGCCGTVDSGLVGEVFRVKSVSYMSLGVVNDDAPNGGEVVKLKNKWIVQTDSDEQAPLKTIRLPAGSAGAPGSVSGLGLREAHVLATDKVIKVAPGNAPESLHTGPTGPVYEKGEWTYAQAVAQYIKIAPGADVLIDMETYGIASAMRALGLSERVVVLRVATDALSDKARQTEKQQLELLRDGSAELAHAIAIILGI
jgi:hypothetical protein